MKIIQYFVLINALVTPLAYAQVGCLDNSYHLTQRYDNKDYHYVECNCPCDRYRAQGLGCADRNKCIECGHFHEARPIKVSTNTKVETREFKAYNLQKMIENYKQRQKQ